MESNRTKQIILTDDDFLEMKRHGTSEFPYQYYSEDFWEYDLHCLDWHWHPEVEFLLVRKGEARCMVSGQEFMLRQNMGLFVNSGRIHRYEASGHCLVPNAAFSPWLLSSEDSLIGRKYIRGLLSEGPDCLVLSSQITWQEEILQKLNEIFPEDSDSEADELRIFAAIAAIWNILFRNIDSGSLTGSDGFADSRSRRLQVMMQYIRQHYQENITLDDIASSAGISKSGALHFFRDGIHDSPVSYLIHYRLQQAAKLLRTTALRVSSVAESTGFASSGYFCRKFHQLYNMTPVEYRKAKQSSSESHIKSISTSETIHRQNPS